MTAQDLMNSILQLAIQGKLVEQRAEEGTARELIEQIKIEKERLIKERKLKKEKLLPKITDEEIPFEIPESWEWVRLGSCISLLSGQDMTPNQYNDIGLGIPYLTGASNIENGKIIINRWTDKPKAIAAKGDLLITCKGTIGATCILTEKEVHIARQIMAITAICIEIEYIHKFLQLYVGTLKNKAKSMIPGIGRKDILNAVFPLPPISEQKRIVAKIEELLLYIEKYDKAYSKLEAYNKKFPEDIQKSILQYAMQGKLVEQRSEEGTGEELYWQIRIEKKQLSKVGKIKNEKCLSEISRSEMPYEIPQSWHWVRLGELGTYKKGPFGSALTKSLFVPKGSDSVKVYEQKNAINKDEKIGEYYITKDYFESKMRGFEVLAGDIIVSCAGTIGETFIMPAGCEQGIINQALMRIRLLPSVNREYFLLYFDFILKDIARKSSKGSAIKNIPPFEELKNYLVAFPPYGEQERIVKRLRSLAPYIHKIKKKEG